MRSFISSSVAFSYIKLSLVIGLFCYPWNEGKAQDINFREVDYDSSYFGLKLQHPNLWLEDINSESTQQWLKQQEEFNKGYFSKADLKKLNSSLQFNDQTFLSETDKYSFRIDTEGYYPPTLSVKKKDVNEPYWPIVKCSKLKNDKYDFPVIADYWVFDNQELVVVAVTHSGSDWLDLLVYSIPDKTFKYALQGVRNAWLLKGNDGFYYRRFDIPENTQSVIANQRLVYHKFYADQEDDKLIFVNQDKNTQKLFSCYKPKNSKWLYVYHSIKKGSSWYEAISLIDLNSNAYQPKTFALYSAPIRLTFDYIYGNDSTAYFRTDMNSPTFQVLKYNLNLINDYEVYVDSYSQVLNDVTYLKDGFFGLEYMDHGHFFGIVIDSLGETKGTINIESEGRISFYPANSNGNTYFRIDRYHAPPKRYLLDLNTMTSEYHSGGSMYTSNDIETVVREYESQGNKVPITLVYHKKMIKKDGSNPTLINVYGGYGINQLPQFDYYNDFFISNGGILVIPNVRGSGALGTNWAFAGKGLNKQNTIDDIIAAADFLIDENYTNPNMLFLEGGSHGGFAVAAAAIQRPELFRGVIANSGAFDLVRITNQNVGNAETNRIEYGDPTDSITFKARLDLSPIHNLTPNTAYPAFLLFAGTSDARVSIDHSYRFLAELQYASLNEMNFIHVTHGGHGLVTYPYEQLEMMSLKFKFMWLLCGYKFWK